MAAAAITCSLRWRDCNTTVNNDSIQFNRLKTILLDLGFVEKSVPERYLIFEHATSGTRLFYHNYRAEDPITWADRVKTRKFLDEKGLLEGKEFDDFLHRSLSDLSS